MRVFFICLQAQEPCLAPSGKLRLEMEREKMKMLERENETLKHRNKFSDTVLAFYLSLTELETRNNPKT